MGRPVLPGRVHATGSVLLPCSPLSVREARVLVRGALDGSGLPADVVDDTVLVVSELVSNALRHARPLPGGTIGLDWAPAAERVEVRVTDGGGDALPAARRPVGSALGGRGLAMVDAVSSRWGVDVGASRVSVWAVLGEDAGRTAFH